MISPLNFRALETGLMMESSCASALLERMTAALKPENRSILDLLREDKPTGYRKAGKVGVVRLHGPIGYGLDPLEKMVGMVDLIDFQKDLKQAYADPEVEKVLIHAETPGGYTTGVQETAALVKASPKPIETFGTSIHSAGLWISGVANRVWGMQSGLYGSIGSVIMVKDISQAAEMQGVKVHVISSGWAKGQEFPGAKVTPEYLEFLRQEVMDNAQAFKSDLTSVRTTIPDAAMQGQSFSGRKAASLGIITGLADSLDSVIDRMNGIG